MSLRTVNTEPNQNVNTVPIETPKSDNPLAGRVQAKDSIDHFFNPEYFTQPKKPSTPKSMTSEIQRISPVSSEDGSDTPISTSSSSSLSPAPTGDTGSPISTSSSLSPFSPNPNKKQKTKSPTPSNLSSEPLPKPEASNPRRVLTKEQQAIQDRFDARLKEVLEANLQAVLDGKQIPYGARLEKDMGWSSSSSSSPYPRPMMQIIPSSTPRPDLKCYEGLTQEQVDALNEESFNPSQRTSDSPSECVIS